jgi:hypothetical protein
MTTSTTSDPPKHSIFQPVSRLTPNPVATINKRASSAHRREKFFSKNREAREETRFEGRSDLAMRRAFVDERRRWEDRLTREAPAPTPEIWEDEEEGDTMDEDGMMEGEGPPNEDDVYGDVGEERQRDSQEFYDEEYESIFAEIAGREGGVIQGAEEGDRGGVMDTSRETRTGAESKNVEGVRDTQLQELNHDMDMTDG